jgi:hypothetical protein
MMCKGAAQGYRPFCNPPCVAGVIPKTNTSRWGQGGTSWRAAYKDRRCNGYVLAGVTGEGPRSRRYGRNAALRLFVQPYDEDKDNYFLSSPSRGTPMEWNWQGKTELFGRKPVPVPLRSSQIPNGLTRGRAWTFARGGQRLTTRAMARPTSWY